MAHVKNSLKTSLTAHVKNSLKMSLMAHVMNYLKTSLCQQSKQIVLSSARLHLGMCVAAQIELIIKNYFPL